MTTETIEIEMNWQTTLPMLLTLYRDGNPEGRRYALGELRRMAELADAYAARAALVLGPDTLTA